MRTSRFFQFLLISLLPLWTVEARYDGFTYPEEIFPGLAPLLQEALANSPELEARSASVEERRGQSLAQASVARSRVVAQGRVLGGYEFRYNPDTLDGLVDTYESRPRAALDASVWWYKPLYYWGNNERYQQIAELQVAASEVDFTETSRRHLTDVREIYLQWVAARHQYAVAQENIQLAERFVNNRRELLNIGRTSPQEVLELEAGLYEAEEALAIYAREKTFFRNQLAIMVGNEFIVARLEDDSAFPEVPMLTIAEIEQLRAQLRAEEPSTPAMQREKLQVQAEETHYESLLMDRRPTIDFVMGAITDRVDSYNINDSAYRISSYAGLQVRWNLFDGHRNRGDRMAALARIRSREARMEMTEAHARSGAERLLANLELNVRQVESRRARAELLERRLQLAESPDSTELIAPIDRLELRLNLLQAKNRVIEAQIQYLIHMSRLAAIYYADPVSGH